MLRRINVVESKETKIFDMLRMINVVDSRETDIFDMLRIKDDKV